MSLLQHSALEASASKPEMGRNFWFLLIRTEKHYCLPGRAKVYLNTWHVSFFHVITSYLFMLFLTFWGIVPFCFSAFLFFFLYKSWYYSAFERWYTNKFNMQVQNGSSTGWNGNTNVWNGATNWWRGRKKTLKQTDSVLFVSNNCSLQIVMLKMRSI